MQLVCQMLDIDLGLGKIVSVWDIFSAPCKNQIIARQWWLKAWSCLNVISFLSSVWCCKSNLCRKPNWWSTHKPQVNLKGGSRVFLRSEGAPLRNSVTCELNIFWKWIHRKKASSKAGGGAVATPCTPTLDPPLNLDIMMPGTLFCFENIIDFEITVEFWIPSSLLSTIVFLCFLT